MQGINDNIIPLIKPKRAYEISKVHSAITLKDKPRDQSPIRPISEMNVQKSLGKDIEVMYEPTVIKLVTNPKAKPQTS